MTGCRSQGQASPRPAVPGCIVGLRGIDVGGRWQFCGGDRGLLIRAIVHPLSFTVAFVARLRSPWDQALEIMPRAGDLSLVSSGPPSWTGFRVPWIL